MTGKEVLMQTLTPRSVTAATRRLGEDFSTWRKLRHLTLAETADRAGIGVSTVMRLEGGSGATLENVLRVARALGVLDLLSTSLDPYATDLGRARSDEQLPDRVRHRPSR
jgi:transcriptional regulator with XRE-family HTH domain